MLVTRTLMIRFFAKTSKFTSYKDVPIDKGVVETNFVRASGAGGQSINKTSSKAQIRLAIDSHNWIDEYMKQRLKQKYSRYLNKQGQIIVTAQTSRSQGQNLQQAIQKLKKMLYQCSLVKEQRKFEIPAQTEQMAEARLNYKRKNSEKKNLRQLCNKKGYKF